MTALEHFEAKLARDKIAHTIIRLGHLTEIQIPDTRAEDCQFYTLLQFGDDGALVKTGRGGYRLR